MDDGLVPLTAGRGPAASGVGSAVAVLRREVREAVARQLPARIREAEAATGRRLTAGQRRAQAQALAIDAAEAVARRRLGAGRPVASQVTEEQVIASVVEELLGLGGLEPLLRDASIENINICGDAVWVRYADGRRVAMPPVAVDDAALVELIRHLAARAGVEERRWDRASPAVSFALPGGERVFAVMALSERPVVSIRRHRHQRVTLAQLRRAGTLDRGVESFLAAAVRCRKNILVTGGASAGKTTLLRALAAEIPAGERLITIEDVFELRLDADTEAHPDLVALQAREPSLEGTGAVGVAELTRWALRMSPDRVIVGEVRGPEVVAMCNAMAQGNDGSMATLHARSSGQAFIRLAAYAAQGPERLSMEATSVLVASAVDLVVHLAVPRGEPGRRVVASVREVVGAEGGQVISNEVFRPGPGGVGEPGAPLRPETAEELTDAGYRPPALAGWEAYR